MAKENPASIGIATFGLIALATCVAGLAAPGPRAGATHGQTAATQRLPLYYTPKAEALLNGVLAPLSSLRVMQRAIALAPDVNVDEIPTLALLASPLKTTGLGPIRIGMGLDDLEQAGLTPIAIENAGNGMCQYYRIKGHSEPMGLMVINDTVLRIDVWPGSLAVTRSGIRIGSTERDLVRAYGQQLEAVSNPMSLGKTVIFTPRDPGENIYRLVFETDDLGQVTEFRAGQFPSVTWAEGCG